MKSKRGYRGQYVMLDEDLAKRYGVEARLLTRAVRRNRERFPKDFVFELTIQEVTPLRSQIGISKVSRERAKIFVEGIY